MAEHEFKKGDRVLVNLAITLKGGDYIEAESDGTKVGGKVSHVTERGFVAIEHLGLFAIHHITPSPLPKGYRMFALTDHTPAPEPEPEWKPGTLVSGEFEGRRAQGLVTEQGDFLFWNHTGGHMQEEPLPTVTDVRPLVVIDPATVDVDGLARAVFGAYDTGSVSVSRREANAIDAGLRFLGIEVPR